MEGSMLIIKHPITGSIKTPKSLRFLHHLSSDNLKLNSIYKFKQVFLSLFSFLLFQNALVYTKRIAHNCEI